MVYRVVSWEQSLHEHCCRCCWRTWRTNEFACVGPTLSTVSCQFCIRCGHWVGLFGHLWPRHWIALYVQVYTICLLFFLSRTARVTITKYCEFEAYMYDTFSLSLFLLNFHPKKQRENISKNCFAQSEGRSSTNLSLFFLKNIFLSRSECFSWFVNIYFEFSSLFCCSLPFS